MSFSYEFDFWGKNRAALDAALGEATAEEAEFAEARLLLTTAIARSYIRGATFARELALRRDMVKVRREALTVAQTRFHTGLGPADAVVQATVDLENVVRLEASTRALLIMQQNSARPADGRGARYDPEFVCWRKDLNSSMDLLPPRLPIELLAHRPDLAAAMYRAEASAKRIHVAKAQFLPSVDLTVATAGLEASVFTKNIATLPGLLFRCSDLNYLVAPGFHLPLFEEGGCAGNWRQHGRNTMKRWSFIMRFCCMQFRTSPTV